MAIQIFTTTEIQVLKQAAQRLVDNPNFAAARQNLTKAEQKTADGNAISVIITGIQAAIDGIDDKYVTLKANELTSLNDSLSFYQTMLTKIQNTPE